MKAPASSEILEALRGVVDPEMGIDVVDLGLVYEATARDGDVHVVMTMTTAASRWPTRPRRSSDGACRASGR